MLDSILSVSGIYNFLGIVLGFLLTNYLGKKIYHAYFGPLSKIPGPKLNAFTAVFSLPTILAGKSWEKIHQKHHPKYGPIFRIDPNCVVIGDPDAIKQVIQTMDFPKDPMYESLISKTHSTTLFTTSDKTFHKQRRRILSPAFSIQYLASLEPLIKICVKDLIFKIDETLKEVEGNNGGTINIYKLIKHTALDVIGETSLGGKFGMVLSGKHPLPGAITELMYKRVLRSYYPILAPFFPDNEYLYKFAGDIIKRRRQQTLAPRKDILQIVLDAKSEKGIGLTDDEIFDQIIEFIIAGSDTTSWSATFAIILLARHQDKLAKLVKELDGAISDITSDHLPDGETLKRLPYLNAVINESLRIWPVGLEAGSYRCTDQDVVLKGYLIPKGTLLLLSFYHVSLSTKYWGEDAKEFIPERWLDPTRIPKDAYFPFSAGSRNCIGTNFALLEMRLIIASIVSRYKFIDISGQPLDICQYVTPSLRNNQYNIRMWERE